LQDVTSEQRRRVVEDDYIHFIPMKDADQVGNKLQALSTPLIPLWVQLAIQEHCDVDIAFGVCLTRSLAAEKESCLHAGPNAPEIGSYRVFHGSRNYRKQVVW
jgi:hypothetical protein